MRMKMIEAAPFIGMIMAECAQVGLMIVSKQAMSNGMSNLIFVFYSNALAAIVLLPFPIIVHRRQSHPPVTFSLICSFFLLGIIGCFAQIFGYAGINYSSPTLGTAMLNLIPAFTFILAVIFRMERVDWRSSSGLAKWTGTIVSIAGASIVTFYKGPPILTTHSSSDFSRPLLLQQSNWVLGGLLLAIDCLLASSWLIIQAKVLRKYPAELVVVFYYCFFVAIQSAAICLVIERDLSAWSLKINTRLYAILYSAVFGSAFQLGISTWCLQRTGPVFVSMFKPFGIAIAVVAGVILFGDTFYSGSLFGAIVIVVGFYSVIWGKSKDKINEDSGVNNLESATPKVPLLQNVTDDF